MSAAREKAKELLKHYFSLVRPGIAHGDGGAELDELVDCIIDAAVEQLRTENRNAANAIHRRTGGR